MSSFAVVTEMKDSIFMIFILMNNICKRNLERVMIRIKVNISSTVTLWWQLMEKDTSDYLT